jgi:hypothetical protein
MKGNFIAGVIGGIIFTIWNIFMIFVGMLICFDMEESKKVRHNKIVNMEIVGDTVRD